MLGECFTTELLSPTISQLGLTEKEERTVREEGKRKSKKGFEFWL
jgi:hypothetical protein